MKKIFTLLSSALLSLIIFTSCVTTSIAIPKKTDLYGVQVKVPKSQKYIIRLYGNLKADTLDVTTVYWFDNWANGWTEARFTATGEIKINHTSQKEDFCEIIQPIILVETEAAKIRYKDTYISGEDGIKALNNRLSRVEAINEEISKNDRKYEYSWFRDYYGDYFFPERFKKSQFRIELNEESETIFGDGVNWNVEYTKKLFPEYMWEARNTGTLYRDWEEAFDLIFVLNRWNDMFGEGSKGTYKVVETTPSKGEK